MSEVFEPVQHVTLWDDEGVIFIKTRDPHGDPVEMSEEEAVALSDLLRKLVEQQR